MMYGGDRTLRSSENAQTNSSKEASMATYTMQELELETAELLPARETLNCYRAHGSSSSTTYNFQSGNVQDNGNSYGDHSILGGWFSGDLSGDNVAIF
jgi:hypothetical protein